MNFIEKSEENVKRSVLKEVATTGGEGAITTGAAPSFVGRGGQKIDGVFMGGMHPKFGGIIDLLQKQLDDRFEKEDYVNKISLPYKTAWEIIFKNYKFDKPGELEGKKKNSKFKSKTTNDFEEVDMKYKYDKNMIDFMKNHIFINDDNKDKMLSYSDVVNQMRRRMGRTKWELK